MFTLDTSAVKAAAAAWRANSRQVVADLRQGAARASQVAVRQMKADAPRRSGDLIDSIAPTLRSTANGASGQIRVGMDYASFVKDGTEPHIIAAKNASVLRWEGGSYGPGAHFAKYVHHPGTKPNDFVTPGVQQGQQVLDNAAQQAVAKLRAVTE